ncbi:MAG TPA: MBL fold metallo-hydrolase [Acetobacteraceae bacterium]|nr:MBL fold metallo-hydrolase [Acetobacteraceae bacterium]
MPGLQPVDRLEIQVLVDNVTDTLSSTPPFVTREAPLLQRQGMRIMSGAAMCCANHGLSLVITAHTASGPRTVLFDGGPVDYAVERNGVRLGIDFGAIGAVMLSHGHWDHAGGLPRAIGLIVQANGGRAVPLHLHPGMFRPRGQRQPDGGVLPMDPIPTPAQWAMLGAEPVVTNAAQICLDGACFISGEIPRITAYETGLVNQVCQPTDGAHWVPDPLVTDERFLAVHVRNKGLVVFSACSHAGIVNVLHHARDTFPDVKLHAVMGGFHLSGPTEAIIPETVRDLGTFGLDLILPAHCTGWRALNALERAYGETVVVPSAVGKRFTL